MDPYRPPLEQTPSHPSPSLHFNPKRKCQDASNIVPCDFFHPQSGCSRLPTHEHWANLSPHQPPLSCETLGHVILPKNQLFAQTIPTHLLVSLFCPGQRAKPEVLLCDGLPPPNSVPATQLANLDKLYRKDVQQDTGGNVMVSPNAWRRPPPQGKLFPTTVANSFGTLLCFPARRLGRTPQTNLTLRRLSLLFPPDIFSSSYVCCCSPFFFFWFTNISWISLQMMVSVCSVPFFWLPSTCIQHSPYFYLLEARSMWCGCILVLRLFPRPPSL